MKHLFSTLSILFLTVFSSVKAQYYVPYNFKRAIEKQTRTETGLPGENYKSNFAEYKISATFNPQTAILEGEETITYHYNSGANTLRTIVMQIYRNVYKKGAIRLRNVDPRDLFDGVELLEVKQDNKNIDTKEDGTLTKLVLNKELHPGNKTKIYVKWRTKIAAYTKFRGGQYTDNTWVIPYWYPQIAVYDDVSGWDDVSHSGNEEFYFEFANYDVNLTIGNNCNVWATGTLTNAEDIYTKKIYNRILKSQTSNEIINIITHNDLGKTLRQEQNTWKFHADSVSDFVFAISDVSYWDAVSTVVDKKTGRRTVVESVYRTPDFEKTTQMTKQTVDYLSSERPGIPFPYPHETIFEGSGGMEFPMFVNERYTQYEKDHFFTTSHEVTHTYFPFYTGINQAKFAFLDEGLTMFVPQKLQNVEYKENNDPSEAEFYSYRYTNGSLENLPIITPSYSYKDIWNFTVSSYYKPQFAYSTLENIVGKEVMDKIIKEFVINWHNKHPYPHDFFNLCKSTSGKNLDEFFGKWFFASLPYDIEVLSVEKEGDKYAVTLKNNGGLPAQINAIVTFTDWKKQYYGIDASIWDNNTQIYRWIINTNNQEIKKFQIINRDYSLDNNSWPKK